MELKEFDYQLPDELIATEPAESRAKAKMLYFSKEKGEIRDLHFFDLPKILKKGDVLVFNDSKVIPARLNAVSNGKKFEILLVKRIKEEIWECWVRPGKKAKSGNKFTIGEDLEATILGRKDDIFILDFNKAGLEFVKTVEKIGKVPLPPYILKRRISKGGSEYKKNDQKDYQTIYAKTAGSVAAPTAGLHFDETIFERLCQNGIQTEWVTLHVSLGTFQPVNCQNIEKFNIHSETMKISSETAGRLNQAKAEGRRIIAVGTTTVRVLESAASSQDKREKAAVKPYKGETKIFIYPGYKFLFVDGLITNFHLPKSSLLLLVSAFAGKENIDLLYNHAIRKKYQFYSYGDGMLLI